MQHWVRTAIVSVAIAGSVSACATATRGTRQNFVVNTQPAGAAAQFSNGASCTTPCTVPVKRNSNFVVTVKKPGYEDQAAQVTHTTSTAGGVAFLGNALVGGLIGATVDLSTGATQDLVPNQLDLSLRPVAPTMQVASLYPPVRGTFGHPFTSGFVQAGPAIVAPNP